MPILDLPELGEEGAWGNKLLNSIEAINEATDAALAQIQDHVTSNLHHPEYEDIPSLTLLLENGLV